MEVQERKCLQCQKLLNLKVGRRDRKFCDEYCKNKFHNEEAYLEKTEIKRIQLILIKNRRILKKLFVKVSNGEVEKERLLKEGFEFEYFTHFVVTKLKGNKYCFCFDYGYRNHYKDKYTIIKAFEAKKE